MLLDHDSTLAERQPAHCGHTSLLELVIRDARFPGPSEGRGAWTRYGLSKASKRVLEGSVKTGAPWPVRDRSWPNPGQLFLWGKVTPAQPAPLTAPPGNEWVSLLKGCRRGDTSYPRAITLWGTWRRGIKVNSPVWVCLCVSRASSFENWAPH